MKNLDELQVYKAAILDAMSKSQEIAKLVSGEATAPPAFDTLLYHSIFPWEYVPDASADPATYLSFEIDVARVANTIKELEITFYLWAHQSLMKTESGTRLDLLANELCNLFHGNTGYGIGKLEWAPEEPVLHESTKEQICKRTVRFLAKDFNLRPRKL